MEKRHILQRSSKAENRLVCTDTENKIVCEFEFGRFNETQKFTMLDDLTELQAEKMLVNKLPLFLGNIYVQHSRIIAYDAVTENLKRKYQGAAFMAMV